MLYHVSSVSGLKILKPHISSHKQAYVYAIENYVTGLLFGAKKDDFDFLLYTDEFDNPVVYECYPDAFNHIYQGKACSVYFVDEAGFLRNQTSWSVELVNPDEVVVADEIRIDDLSKALLEEEKKGNLTIFRYRSDEVYRKKIAEHILDRMIRFELDLESYMQNDERFSSYYKDFVLALLAIQDGHLLPQTMR